MNMSNANTGNGAMLIPGVTNAQADREGTNLKIRHYVARRKGIQGKSKRPAEIQRASW